MYILQRKKCEEKKALMLAAYEKAKQNSKAAKDIEAKIKRANENADRARKNAEKALKNRTKRLEQRQK